MDIYLTTDTHFGHDKMPEYCGRPIGFEQLIFKEWKILKPEDVLVHLGDVCIGNDKKWHAMFIQTLPCKKWLVRGNHDMKSDKWYLEHGWDFVSDQFTGEYFGKRVTFSHVPVSGIYDVNIHGHFHNNLERLKRKEFVVEGEEERNREHMRLLTPKHHLISLELNNYTLTNLRSICESL